MLRNHLLVLPPHTFLRLSLSRATLQAMTYLHGLGITHGSLRPSNVLLKGSSQDRRCEHRGQPPSLSRDAYQRHPRTSHSLFLPQGLLVPRL